MDEFERLRAYPGFRLDPMPWEQVILLVAENTTESLCKLGRAPSGSVVYFRFKEKVRFTRARRNRVVGKHAGWHDSNCVLLLPQIEKEYASVADYMQKTVFDFPVELTAGTSVWQGLQCWRQCEAYCSCSLTWSAMLQALMYRLHMQTAGRRSSSLHQIQMSARWCGGQMCAVLAITLVL